MEMTRGSAKQRPQDALIRELDRQQRKARRELRRPPPGPKYTPEQLAEVPF